MSTEIDLKALWNKEEAKDIPDTKELLKKAGNLRKAARIRLIIQSVVLSAIVALLLCVGLNIDHRELTTTVGLILMLAAIVSYLIATNQLLPMLFKSDIEGSSQEYLNQLIRIKRKNEFLDKVMVNIYFSLLMVGISLYMLQFAMKMSTAWAVFIYAITLTCLTATWVYSRTRKIKSMLKPLNDTIKKLEAVNEQLREQ